MDDPCTYSGCDDVSTSDHVFNIINDIGKRGSYYHKRFEMIDVTRDKKIDDILND